MEKRKCAFKNCVESFTIKNPKKMFCNNSCKNKAAYLYELETYPWEVKQFKIRRKNIQILEYLYNQKKTLMTISDLNLLGFDATCGIIPTKNELGQWDYRYGNIKLTILSGNECKITKI